MATPSLKSLEEKLDLLIRYCHKLERENDSLRAKEEVWSQERKRLVEKNEIARTRVEAMIQHLKALESES